MNKFKRILGLILAVCMLLGSVSLIGCGGEKTYTDEYGDTYTLDADGNKVYKIIVYDNASPWASTEAYRQDVLNAINERCLQELGFKVEIDYQVYGTNLGQRLNADLTSRERVDVTRNHIMSEIYARIDGKTAKDITDIFNQTKNFKTQLTEEQLNVFTVDGKLYAIPVPAFSSESCLWVRPDMLIEAGYVNSDGSYKIPENIEEFEDMLEALLPVLSKGNKVASMALDFQDMETFFYGSFTETPAAYVENGKLVPKYYSDSYKQFLLKMRDWIARGLVMRPFDGRASEQAIGDAFKRGRVAVMGYNIYQLQWGVINDWKNKGYDEVAPIPLFYEDALNEGKSLYGEKLSNQYMWFPYTSESTRATILFYDWVMYDPEIYDLCTIGIEGKTYEVVNGNELKLPDSEYDESAMVTAPRDLMGEFILTKSVAMATRWRDPSVCIQYDDLQRMYSNFDASRFYFDPLNSISNILDNDLDQARYQEACDLVLGEIQKLIDNTAPGYYSDAEFDAKYDAMLRIFEEKGGLSAYDVFTQRYLG